MNSVYFRLVNKTTICLKSKPSFLFIDLPTLPKGVLSLSLINVASCLQDDFHVKISDFNLLSENERLEQLSGGWNYIGFKVSSQNFELAKYYSKQIASTSNKTKLVFGGEFPSYAKSVHLLL